jgi:hypothetical protein
MINRGRLSAERGSDIDLGPNPTDEDIRTLVEQFKADGLCGRRIAEHRLGPYFLASDEHGQREIELLDEVLEDVYADSELCIRTRQSGCSRLRGGCKRSR